MIGRAVADFNLKFIFLILPLGNHCQYLFKVTFNWLVNWTIYSSCYSDILWFFAIVCDCTQWIHKLIIRGHALICVILILNLKNKLSYWVDNVCSPIERLVENVVFLMIFLSVRRSLQYILPFFVELVGLLILWNIFDVYRLQSLLLAAKSQKITKNKFRYASDSGNFF